VFIVIKNRNYVLTIILLMVTLGLYGLYWIYKLAKDVNTICNGDGKKTRGLLLFFLFSLITVGIYGYVWYFMLGDRLQENALRYGLSFKEGGGTILLWAVLGSFIIIGPFISLYIVTKNLNALALAYNTSGPAAAQA
jgi:heme/copper-type cytochrome/quinol oxidase subunit 2